MLHQTSEAILDICLRQAIFAEVSAKIQSGEIRQRTPSNFFYDSSIVASRREEKGNQRFWGVAACLSARSCHVDLDARRAKSRLSALTSLDYPGGKKLNLSLPLHCRKFQHSARWQGRWIHVLQTDSQHSKIISWSNTVFQVKWTWNVLNLETFIHTFAKSCSKIAGELWFWIGCTRAAQSSYALIILHHTSW